MTPELKAAWIGALRSGNYKQGRDCLRDTNGAFCCLGVLCDVANTGWAFNEEIKEWETNHGDHEVLSFPKESLGLSQEIHDICWYMNDGGDAVLLKHGLQSRPYTFAEIADWLEDQDLE